jgi:hypothetical protein
VWPIADRIGELGQHRARLVVDDRESARVLDRDVGERPIGGEPALDRGAELAPLGEAADVSSPWLESGLASAAGDFARAAAVYERIGAAQTRRKARLRDGAALVRAGRLDDAEEQLHRAEAFFRSVRAAVPLAEIEALRARVHA